ncbi:RNA-directed DNA polymerase, eukaryota, reverse transcriptase zinc-binding domain protein [Tanacetum coccineum]
MEKDKENEVSNKESSTSQRTRNENGVLGTNRFTLMDSLVDEEELSPNIEQRKIVDEFLIQEYEQNKDILDENYVDKNDVLRNEVGGNNDWMECWANSNLDDITVKAIHFSSLIETIDKRVKILFYSLSTSNGSANPSSEMSQFQDCVNCIEVDDLHSEGFYYTWTKSLRNPSCKTLKKLDRIMDKDVVKLWKSIKKLINEYSLLCQKAKVEWLKEGDRNTTYFYKTLKERAHRGRIMSIRNEDGIRFENENVAVQIVRHFEEFLGKNRPVQSLNGRNAMFLNKLNNDEALKMIRQVSDAEIKNAINATLISLVPKIPTPDKVSDFRPIACCNVLYKCISKILTNRIKRVLGSLVDENQSAFIGGRQITNNILLSQELFRGYNRKMNKKKVAFKIDLQKAYDTISWEFIKEALVMFGFHEKMVSWIMTCVTTTKFSIIINGERVVGMFMITMAYNSVKITHLCFADDLLVFCNGDQKSVNVIKESLDEFSGVSGLVPNMQKSTIFFGGLSNAEQQVILNIIPFTVGKLPVRYLGVPIITKKIIEKLKGKSIWEVQGDSNSSVGWKNILSLREKVRKHIGWKIGDGKSINVWHDKWCNVSPLSDFIDSRDIYDARLGKECTLNEIISDGRWVWPEEWNSDFEVLRNVQIPVLDNEVKDKATWITNNGIEKCFTVGNVWTDMICDDTKVDWFKLVWFSQSIPRHAFVTWVAIQKRLMSLLTRIRFGEPYYDFKCALCSNCPDSHNHLFFSCEFSKEIWKELIGLLNVGLSSEWI